MQTDNHANSRVPESETVSGLRIAQIIVGIAITLPAFLVGASVVRALGLQDGIIAICIGGTVLTAIALTTMGLGAKERLSTYGIVASSFGRGGARLVNLLIASTLSGWYGVTVALFADALDKTLLTLFGASPGGFALTIIGSLIMTVTTIFGFRAIDGLSRLAVPAMFSLLVYAVYKAVAASPLPLLDLPGAPTEAIGDIGSAASVIIGSFMVGVTIIPDMSRYARSYRDSVTGCLLSYGSGSLAVLIFAGIPFLVTGESDFFAAMTALELGVPALLVIIFATWTTNVNNLYSASLGFAQVFPRVRDIHITIVAGLLGTVIAVLGILEYFVSFLGFLSVTIPPIAAIYITHAFMVGTSAGGSHLTGTNHRALIAWILSMAAQYGMVALSVTATSVQALDTFLLAAVTYALMTLVYRRLN